MTRVIWKDENTLWNRYNHHQCWAILNSTRSACESLVCHFQGWWILPSCSRNIVWDTEISEWPRASVKSGSCIWAPKAGPSTVAIKAIGIKVGRDDMDDSHSDMNDDDLNVIGDKPSVASFMETVKQHFPDACLLDTYEVREKAPAKVPTLDVLTPQNLVDIFTAGHDCIESDNCTNTCLDELEQCLTYAPEDILKIEKATRGQAENENWHVMRNCIVSASKFKLVYHSTN